MDSHPRVCSVDENTCHVTCWSENSSPWPVLTLTVELTHLEVKAPFASPRKPLGCVKYLGHVMQIAPVTLCVMTTAYFFLLFWAINGHVRSRHGNTCVTFASYVCWKNTEVRGGFALRHQTCFESDMAVHEWSHLPGRSVDGFLSSLCATFSQSLAVNSLWWRIPGLDHVTQNTFAAWNNEA